MKPHGLGWCFWLCLAFITIVVSFSAPARAQPSVSERVSSDLASGQDVVVVSYVALWNPPPPAFMNRPADPYWDALYGHDTFFERGESLIRHMPFLRLGSWSTRLRQQRSSDPISIKAMQASVPGKDLGRMIVVYLVYFDRMLAMHDMTVHLKTGRPPSLTSVTQQITKLLESSYIVGYWGHNTYRKGYNPDRLEDIQLTTSDLPRGVFVVGCQTAIWYPQKVLPLGVEPLLFTTNKMPPEGYVAAAFYDGLAFGLDKQALRRHVARAVQVYHGMSNPPTALFVNTEEDLLRLQVPVPVSLR